MRRILVTSDEDARTCPGSHLSISVVEQPFLKPIDFSKSDDVLLSETEEMCRAAPGFRAHADFNAELARRVPASLSD